jgi:hypothetical protein
MNIDLDFDFDYLRVYFKLSDYQDYFYCSKCEYTSFIGYTFEMEFTLNNNGGLINDYCAVGFEFDTRIEEMSIRCWNKNYDFDIPLYLFVSKTKEYVDHFNWIKEAYVS